ncbi:PINIT domain-containing protein [Xylaria sp. CBS 124048]|nr:PINIT domain-containing protein [Xylaria sp. CBS 124048]
MPPIPGGGSNGFGYPVGKSTFEPPAGSARYQFSARSQPLSQTRGVYGNPGTSESGLLSYHKMQSLRDVQFKPSPFYSIISRIGDIHTSMAQHRHTIHMSIKAADHANLKNLTDKSYRIMIFCAADNSGVQDITFPHQSEFKVNGGEVKANLRGLKGKPGTTRPVDITDLLRLKPSVYNNNVEFTYALTTKKFYLMAYLCRMVPVDELVEKIRGKKITKSTVIKEMDRKAQDPDVVATSTVLSLKCPLSYTRLRTPCRSVTCNHVQCFDATSYLQLQEQGPQWICPICNKSAVFESLAIDEYVKDILDKTKDSVEQVTIEPNGQWVNQSAKSTSQNTRAPDTRSGIDVDDEDDISIIADNSAGASHSPNGSGTPARSFIAENSVATRSGSKKRSAAEVIDLTFSSDEDDEPIARPIKRQNVGPSSGCGGQFSRY